MREFHRSRAMRYRERQPAVQLVMGLVIAAVGVLFTLDNLHLLRARDFIRYWPAALIAVGLAQIAQARTSARVWSGALWTTVGVLMLANRLGLTNVNIWAYWPLLLVFVGGRIFLQSFYNQSSVAALPDASGNPAAPSGDAAATVSAVAILGGFDRKVTSTAFQHAELTAFMGGGKLDLRDAVPVNGRAVVDSSRSWAALKSSCPRAGPWISRLRRSWGDATTRPCRGWEARLTAPGSSFGAS